MTFAELTGDCAAVIAGMFAASLYSDTPISTGGSPAGSVCSVTSGFDGLRIAVGELIGRVLTAALVEAQYMRRAPRHQPAGFGRSGPSRRMGPGGRVSQQLTSGGVPLKHAKVGVHAPR